MLAIYIISKWTADGFLGNVEKSLGLEKMEKTD